MPAPIILQTKGKVSCGKTFRPSFFIRPWSLLWFGSSDCVCLIVDRPEEPIFCCRQGFLLACGELKWQAAIQCKRGGEARSCWFLSQGTLDFLQHVSQQFDEKADISFRSNRKGKSCFLLKSAGERAENTAAGRRPSSLVEPSNQRPESHCRV